MPKAMDDSISVVLFLERRGGGSSRSWWTSADRSLETVPV